MRTQTYKLFFCSLLFFNISFSSASLQKGFKALTIFDYFKAKKLFTSLSKKNNCYAQFGLASIFYRNDNPFHNLDSAAKYARLSFNFFVVKNEEKKYLSFKINQLEILNLIDSIAQKQLMKVKQNNTIAAYEDFITKNYLTNYTLIDEAINARDELIFNQLIKVNTSKATQNFITSYSESRYLQEGYNLKEEQVFAESTQNKTEIEFYAYIKQHPKSKFVTNAQEGIFLLAKQNNDIAALTKFVYSQPSALQNNEAWKLLFALSVKDYSNESLSKFIRQHPSFPFKDNIVNELNTNNLVQYPYLKNDYYGLLDSNLNLTIPAIYDEISSFNEGLYVVTKNDSTYYINKKNENAFGTFYKEAFAFKYGIGAVHLFSNTWHFINRQAQIISPAYEEINELSDNIYVIKQNGKFGAVSNYGQPIIEPQFELLGNFKNGFAYYQKNQKYGLISNTGMVYKAHYDWVSDVTANKLAVAKLNNKFGIISPDTLLLELNYDQVIELKDNIYLLVQNNKYGFFNSKSNCFVTQISYDFFKDKPTDFYYKNNLYKLIKNKQQALVDANGRLSIDFGLYDEINFASNNLIKVKRNNKFGFVDRKLNLVIPYQYQTANDFRDSISIARKKENYILVNLVGKEVAQSSTEIVKISQHYYLINESILVDNTGKEIFNEIDNVQKVYGNILIITFKNQNIQLLKDYY